MRLPETAHTSRPWRIHEITQDFRVEDVWSLPTPGGANDFPLLVDAVIAFDLSQSSSWAVRTLVAIRWKLGALFGLDRPKTGIDARVRSLRERLPLDLQSAATGPSPTLPFRPLFALDDEWAAEIANETMHGVLHLGWVRDDQGGYRGQLAVLVKPNGRLGAAYMAAIKPFRHLIVYPMLMKDIEHAWRAHVAEEAAVRMHQIPEDA